MSRLNNLVREMISFVGGPWLATADLVLVRVVTKLYFSPMHTVEVSTLSDPTKIMAKNVIHEK